MREPKERKAQEKEQIRRPYPLYGDIDKIYDDRKFPYVQDLVIIDDEQRCYLCKKGSGKQQKASAKIKIFPVCCVDPIEPIAEIGDQ